MSSLLIRPQITILNPAHIEQIHAQSLKILSTVGLRVDSAKTLQTFAQAGCETDADQRVRIPAALVEQALHTAPNNVAIYNRQGQLAFCLNDEQTRFGIGVTALYYQDPQTDDVTPFARQHIQSIVRLGHNLDSFDVISTIGIIQDVPADVADLYTTLDMAANTDKPLVILVSQDGRFADTLDLLAHLCGDLAARPFAIPYLNPVSPLLLNQGTTDKMRVAIERGLPFIFSNYGMAGATTPITPGGTLALLNAELLSGLTLSQLIKPGAPIILGSLPAFFDMRGMGSFYDLNSYALNLACAEMMAFYKLPHCGTSGSGMGWGVDLLAGGHQWANHLSSCLGKVGLAPFVGDNIGSKAFSPAITVYANEIIAQARRLARGFALDDTAKLMDELAQIGPGGHFLESKLTLKHFRDAYYQSKIWPNLTLEEWQQKGQPQAIEYLRQQTQELLATARPPDDHADLSAQGEAFINTLL